MKTIQPFGDRVLVKVVEPRQQTASGIYLPDSSREGPREAEIVALGEGSPLAEKLAVGDVVLYQKFAGTEIKLEDGTYVLLAEQDVLGRVVELDQLRSAPARELLTQEAMA
jgi:chaperonin GroES